jgi:antitoxin component YwqK of YwqJK toxin-antitoxin module
MVARHPKSALALLAVMVMPLSLCAQEEAKKNEPRVQEGQFTFDTDKPFSLLELDQKIDEPIVTKKKKPRKKVYYGIKTKKGFTRKGFGNKVTIELFYYIKKSEKPNTFVRDIYWYDFRRREVRKTSTFDPAKGVLLHGPYRKMQNGVILEEGIFYKGMKHGRWMRFNRDDLVEDKEKYYKGWPKESLVTYYDPMDRKKIKEIVPIEYNEREGYYYLFHENGKIAVVGEFQWDQRVNNWIENYPDGTRKRIIVYPKEAFDKMQKPYIQTEWDEKGEQIYSKD